VTQVAAGTTPTAVAVAEDRGHRPRYLRWWREVLYILAFYGVYSVIRNTQGSASVSAAHALSNAREIIHLERILGLYQERWVQQQFLSWRGFIEFWNLFYGTFHFVVTAVALVLLFRRDPQRYPLGRNALAFTTAAALIGFAFYPLMPPRLLPFDVYGFVDTLQKFGSPWSFDSGAMHKISNQYAAMPSLHFAWATWSTVVLMSMVKKAWARVAVILYPVATLFAIVVTANHFVLDAVAGAAVLGLAAAAALLVTRRQRPVTIRTG
jgi:PAP2 superfamily protein